MRKIILGVGLFLATPRISSFLLGTDAHAQTAPVFAQNVQVILPGTPAVADGSTTVVYQFLFVDKNGQPIKGLKGRTTLGKAKGYLTEHQNGLYSTRIVPEKRSSDETVSLVVSAKNASKAKVTKTFKVPLKAAPRRTFEVTSSPSEITLTQDEFVTVNITQTGGSPTSKLLIDSNVGKVENIVSLGNGKFSARYTPPEKKPYPHVALFTISDASHPANKATYILQQKGKTNFPVNTLPDSNVIIQIAGRDFGPVQTNSSGKASIPIVVPPGVKSAKLITIANEKRSEEPLDLKIPNNVQRINFFPVNSDVPADGQSEVTLHIFASTTSGKPDSNADIRLKSDKGSFGSIKNDGKGMYSVTYKVPFSNEKDTVQISAVLRSETGDNVDSFSLELLPAIPAQMIVKSESSMLMKNAQSFNVLTTMKNTQGAGMSGRGITFAANGAKVIQTKELGNGDYTTKFSPTSNGPVELTAVAKGSTSSNPAAGIGIYSSQSRLPSDGLSSSLLSFIVHDRFGYPLSNQTISLEIISGNGSLPSQVSTNSAGVANVTFTAGKTPGIVKIKATAGNHENQLAILQLPAEVLPALESLPRSGTSNALKLEESLGKFVNTLRIEREGMEGAQIEANLQEVGDTDAINVTPEPSKITPGGKLTLKIAAVDSNGRGVVGEQLEATVSTGAVGRILDLGDGLYSVIYTADENASEPVKITVSTADGKISTSIELELILPTVVETPVETVEEPEEGPSAAELRAQKKAEKAAARAAAKEGQSEEPAELPWLRLNAGYTAGFYGYQQVPTSTDGVLYGKSITFNNQVEGSASAATAGFDFQARGHIPALEYVGYSLKIHSDNYSVILPEFPDPIVDFVTSFDVAVIGQYPVAAGPVTLVPGMRLGFLRDDLMIFRQNILDNGETELTYEPLSVNALSVGAIVGLESSFGLFGTASFDAGIRGNAYRKKLEGQLGYTFPFDMFVYTSGRSSVRDIDIDGIAGKVGELHDMNRSIVFGAGYQFQ